MISRRILFVADALLPRRQPTGIVDHARMAAAQVLVATGLAASVVGL